MTVSKLPAPDLKGRQKLCISAGPSMVILTLLRPIEARSSATFFLKREPFVTRVKLYEAAILSAKDFISIEMDLTRPMLNSGSPP